MTKIGLLTCQRLPNLTDADQTLIPLFAQHNIIAEAVIWDDATINWQNYDLLIIRNTWDYYVKSQEFGQWMNLIETQNVVILNSIEVVRQNIHKFYLKEFQENGVKIIPTLFSSASSPITFEDLLATQWDKVVIKPAISAGSYQTEVYSMSELTKQKLEEIIVGK